MIAWFGLFGDAPKRSPVLDAVDAVRSLEARLARIELTRTQRRLLAEAMTAHDDQHTLQRMRAEAELNRLRDHTEG